MRMGAGLFGAAVYGAVTQTGREVEAAFLHHAWYQPVLLPVVSLVYHSIGPVECGEHPGCIVPVGAQQRGLHRGYHLIGEGVAAVGELRAVHHAQTAVAVGYQGVYPPGAVGCQRVGLCFYGVVLPGVGGAAGVQREFVKRIYEMLVTVGGESDEDGGGHNGGERQRPFHEA